MILSFQTYRLHVCIFPMIILIYTCNSRCTNYDKKYHRQSLPGITRNDLHSGSSNFPFVQLNLNKSQFALFSVIEHGIHVYIRLIFTARALRRFSPVLFGTGSLMLIITLGWGAFPCSFITTSIDD